MTSMTQGAMRDILGSRLKTDAVPSAYCALGRTWLERHIWKQASLPAMAS
jgi:hypothetical protein